MKTKMQITLSKNVLDVLETKSEQLGITPNVLARIQLYKIFGPVNPDDISRYYIIEMENWRELEAYVKARGFGDMSIFLNKAAESYMRRNRLSDAQKTAAVKNINE